MKGSKYDLLSGTGHERGGETDPAGVADALDLALGEVYEALAYYYNNPEGMRSYRTEQEAALEELRERTIEPPIEPGETR
ncbi:MAG: hypothetical protein ABEH88_08530 [Halobacteriales archaeon]